MKADAPLRYVQRRLLNVFLKSLSTVRRRRLTWRLMAETGVESIACERNGLVWNLRPHDDISWGVFMQGGFQVGEMKALTDWMRRSGVLAGSRNVVIDAGANIGTTCVPLVRETGCRALAIEPVEENVRYLRRNVESNGLSDRIHVARKAVARAPGVLKMCLTEGASGGHFVARGNETGGREQVIAGYEEVQADTLAGIVASAGLSVEEIALVWADVQGCELDVIETGSALWERGVPLWAEVEPGSLRHQGALEVFARAAAAHFDRFIDARDLMRLGEKAAPRPMREFDGLIEGITPEQMNTDVLLLPVGFKG